MSRPPGMNEPQAHEAPDGGTDRERALAAFTALRPRLVGVAYALLGSVAEAEDVVQDAWIRLQRAIAPGAPGSADAAPERAGGGLAGIEDLTGWLVTTTSRLALDVLRSARTRREAYVGPWLPEPVETAPDPADTVGLADAMSWAMLVVLETLSPAERAAFVLHDVFGLTFDEVARALGRSPAACRKLASRAREHVEERRPRFDVDPERHRAVVEAFAAAAGTGDLDRLLALLAPDAVLVSDGGGVVTAALKPIRGAERIARFMVGIRARFPERVYRFAVVNGEAALLAVFGDRVDGVVAVGVEDGRVARIDFVRNPHKFHGLRTARAEP